MPFKNKVTGQGLLSLSCAGLRAIAHNLRGSRSNPTLAIDPERKIIEFRMRLRRVRMARPGGARRKSAKVTERRGRKSCP